MSRKKRLWDQQEGEPDSAYVRFVFYRNLGPGRTLTAAYRAWAHELGEEIESADKCRAPGPWYVDCREQDWIRRANVWDIETFQEAGREAVVAYMHLVRKVAVQALQRVASVEGPKTWKQILETVSVLSSLIPKESVTALLDPTTAGADGPEATEEDGPPDAGRMGASVSVPLPDGQPQ